MTSRLVVAVRNDLTRDNRARKMAASFTDAGWSVVRLGIRTSLSQPTDENTPHGQLHRIATTRHFSNDSPTTPSSASKVSTNAAALIAIRQALGRLRDSVLYFRHILRIAPSAVVVMNADLGPLVWLLRHLSRVVVVYDARELWVEQWPDAHAVYRVLFGAFERAALRSAHTNIAVNALIADELSRRYHVSAPLAVHNGPGECAGVDREVAAPIRLLFQGSFAADRSVDAFIRAMPDLRGIAHLTLQGFGGSEMRLRSLATELDVTDIVTFADPVAPESIVLAASDHDLGLVPTGLECSNLLLSSPNKVFDYLGGGLALLVPDFPFMETLIRDFECGVIVAMDDPAAISSAVRQLAEDSRRLRVMRANARRACDRYLWDRQAHVLLRAVGQASRKGDPT